MTCARAHDRSRPATQSRTAYHMNDRSGPRSPPLPCLARAPFCACASRSMLTVYTVVQTLRRCLHNSGYLRNRLAFCARVRACRGRRARHLLPEPSKSDLSWCSIIAPVPAAAATPNQAKIGSMALGRVRGGPWPGKTAMENRGADLEQLSG